MTRRHLEAVIEKGKPFTIRLADGRSYKVPHRDYISLPPTSAGLAIVYENDGAIHLLSLLTVTSVTFNAPPRPARKRQS